MVFTTMDPEEVRQALRGHKDVLTSAVQQVDEYFKHLSCPSCGAECMKFIDGSRLFREGAVLPNYLARCKACGVEFEPYTKIQVSIPHPGKVTF